MSVFELDPGLLEQHPTYVVGVVFVHGTGAGSPENSGALERALRGAAELAWRLGGAGLHAHPAKQAFEAAGINPRSYAPSMLAQRCLRGEYIRSINPALILPI